MPLFPQEAASFALTTARRHALSLLYEAHLTALEFARSSWDYACQLPNLQRQGVTETTLRWLVDQGLAAHQQEITLSPGDRRQFRLAPNLRLEPTSCFTLTAAGQALLETLPPIMTFDANNLPLNFGPPTPAPCPQTPVLPHYDSQARVLSYAGRIVKHFRVPAENQELILQAFQEENWPRHIDDPLPPSAEMCSKKRLSDAVYRLNCRQTPTRLRFSLNGAATGIHWRLIDG